MDTVNREKNNFLIKLANDFKAPIQSIVGFSQAMADGLGGEMSEQQEKYIRIINKNSTDLMYFVGKLLELSQTESCLSKAENKTFDVSRWPGTTRNSTRTTLRASVSALRNIPRNRKSAPR